MRVVMFATGCVVGCMVYPEEGGSGPIKEVYVYCPNCMTRGPVIYRHYRSYGYCKEQAMLEWNRRA